MWQARRDGLIVTSTEQETLVYDQDRQELHHLNPLATLVWQQADGQTSTDAMLESARTQVDARLSITEIDLALTMLAEANLLQGTQPSATSSRRRLIRAATAGAVALPLVVSISAPSAAAANSSCTSLPSNRFMEVQFQRNDAGECNVVVFVANYCPNRDYTAQLSVQAQGQPIFDEWDAVIATDGDGYGSVFVISWPEITSWLFTATVGGYSYGPVSSYCPA